MPLPPPPDRDHGGGLDAAAARHGGARGDWLDLSTGINPLPYPLPDLPLDSWTALPDQAATVALERAARAFWGVPDGATVLAAPGASALIAAIPRLAPAGRVAIAGPTYNEHQAAFIQAGWTVGEGGQARVVVHPNNPDGRFHAPSPDGRLHLPRPGGLLVIDESFCDVVPGRSLIGLAGAPGVVVLKSFGKFWGLAGLRLGFAIGDPALVGGLAAMLGPWPVSGPALAVGTAALGDLGWADATRARLARDAARLDALIGAKLVGASLVGGTDLFRLYQVADASQWQQALAEKQIWVRAFPYNPRWLRFGLPGTTAGWARLAAALDGVR